MSGLELFALLPVLVLALGATGLLMVGAWWPDRKALLFCGIAIALVAAVLAGGAAPPVTDIAGMFSAGPYARFFAILWSMLAALTLLLSGRYAEDQDFPAGEFPSLLLFAAAGMILLSSATSLIGMFLGLESFTLTLYILIAIDKKSSQGTEAGLKYLVMGIVATGFLGFGMALIYAATGSFQLPDAFQLLEKSGELRPIGLLGWAMLLSAIGFKISLVPFHLWTPDVYQGAPAPISAVLSTGSKGAVLAVLVTVMVGIPATLLDSLAPLLWALSAGSMVVGTICALRQKNLKRMLAYSSTVHMGLVLGALLAGGEIGWGAVVFYVVVYTVANLGAFGVLSSFSMRGGEPQDYRELYGVGYHHPRRSTALAVFLLSLAGIPPTAGFIGKFGIFHALLKADLFGLALIGILTALVSVYYYLRPIIILFMAKERSVCLHQGNDAELAVIGVCMLAILLLGLYPGPLFDLIAAIIP
ncbi:MAG: NADH-quinone oxidoreductase subunit N [Desulfuromonas sp.]|nr:MAG: NADH-quinone oxidoreductase subunit N [Desulfuromonas sp.]